MICCSACSRLLEFGRQVTIDCNLSIEHPFAPLKFAQGVQMLDLQLVQLFLRLRCSNFGSIRVVFVQKIER